MGGSSRTVGWRCGRPSRSCAQAVVAGSNVAGVSGLGTTVVDGSVDVGSGSGSGGRGRVAVVFERSSAGSAALREAAELANTGHEVSVVTLAPQARAARWGRAGGEGPYNVAVREEAELDLQQAREVLGSVASRVTFKMLSGCPQPPLASWVTEHGFGLVLLPHQRLTPGGNPFARSLRKKTSAEVRLVR
jgi:Universal stress protein family